MSSSISKTVKKKYAKPQIRNILVKEIPLHVKKALDKQRNLILNKRNK